MLPQEIIASKRDGKVLSRDEIRFMVAGLTDAQLDTPYRDGGWSVRQLVHHVADSHMNGYIRLKLGNTCGICEKPGFGFKL